MRPAWYHGWRHCPHNSNGLSAQAWCRPGLGMELRVMFLLCRMLLWKASLRWIYKRTLGLRARCATLRTRTVNMLTSTVMAVDWFFEAFTSSNFTLSCWTKTRIHKSVCSEYARSCRNWYDHSLLGDDKSLEKISCHAIPSCTVDQTHNPKSFKFQSRFPISIAIWHGLAWMLQITTTVRIFSYTDWWGALHCVLSFMMLWNSVRM